MNTASPLPRIAYLVSRYPAISHTFILREVTTLRELGFDICVASINSPDRSIEKLTATERDEQAQTFYLKQAGIAAALNSQFKVMMSRPLAYFKTLAYALKLGGFDLKKLLFCLFYFVEAVMIGQWMQQKNLNHLHVHFANPAATVALLVNRLFGIDYSITVHGPDEFYNVNANYLPEKIQHAAFICCISHYAQSQLMAFSNPKHWDKFEISPLGVDPQRFDKREPRINPKPFNVVCVGRLVAVKGQAILLKAMTRLQHAGRDVHLYMVGDGSDRELLKELTHSLGLEALVTFTGAVNQDKILEYYQQADVFALASFAEGVPVVLMEAMAMGIPCVTTHITGIPELIEAGQGLLTPPSDDEKLANAIILLMDNPNLYAQISSAAREKILRSYHLQNNTLRLAEIFKRRLG